LIRYKGRIPARQRLSHRGRVSAPNLDGWREILPQQEARPATTSPEPCRDAKQARQTRKVPMELHGRCFNCLSYSHQVATCRLPQRCLRCQGFSHLAWDCKWPRHTAASAMKDGGRPRHPAHGGNSTAPLHASRGGSSEGLTGGVSRTRQIRWRRRSEPARGVSFGAPAGCDGNVAAAAAARCFPASEQDPLALELWACSGPPAWIDPMLEEFATSLVVSPQQEHARLLERAPLRKWTHHWWTPVLR
jgi:hypothetical protein